MKRTTNNTFTSITTQGGMFPPEFLQRICDLDKDVKGLAAVDYHLPEHRRVSEEANRAWSVLLADWKAFKAKVDERDESDPATGLTRDQWLLPLFQQLGYGRLKKAGATTIEGKDYPVSHFWEQSPIHLVGWNLNLDTRSAGVAGAARFAPHGMMQEFLNRSDEHLWGFVSNGRKLRILRDNVSMTRQAYIEFDLVAMMEGECFSDFVLLWLLCHPSRVEVPVDENGTPRTPEACWLERWSCEAETQGARLLDHLREGVEETIRTFGSGFLSHPANQALREKLRSGELDKQDYYRQLLRLVYRLIFLFVAEDRDLLHETGADTQKKKRYFDHYSTQRIRRIAEAKRGSRHRDLWESFKLLFSWLSDENGCDRLGLAPLGGFLFSNEAMPDLAAAKLSNVDLLNAVRALCVTADDGTRRPVDYRNLGAEELGSIYESLLEMHPNLNLEAATFELDVAAGNERKSTGSYYTPKQLVNCLLDSALDPVVADRLKAASKQSSIENRQSAMEEAMLDLKICDPACGSGHFLIGAAHRIAKHLASVRSGDAEPSPEATHHALRDVITHCIYGVDINPMSVELCKVSLWMEAMEPGKPLGFLDHHIKCGNSLLGTTPALLSRGIPDAAFKPIEGDDKAICAALKKRNKEERVGGAQDLFGNMESEWSYQHAFEDAVHEVDLLSDDSIQSLEKKQLAYEEFRMSTSYVGGKRLHDAWCAAFVQPKAKLEGEAPAEPVIQLEGDEIASQGAIMSEPLAVEGGSDGASPSIPKAQSLKPKASPPITQQLLAEMQVDPNRCPQAERELIDQLAEQYAFFHWHIEFPDVFHPLEEIQEKDLNGWSGGFSCILGNPPWDMQETKDNEFFASSFPEILAVNSAKDKGVVFEKICREAPQLWEAYQEYVRVNEGQKHLMNNSGRFPLSSIGRMNLYRLFLEMEHTVTTVSGRVGIVMPSGFASDSFSQTHFRELHSTGRLISMYDFENRRKLFPAVDSRYKFCLLTVGEPCEGRQTDFVFFAHEVPELSLSDRHISLSGEDLALLNPLTQTAPLFRSNRDFRLTHQLQAAGPILGEEHSSDGWNIKPKLMFMMNAAMKGHQTGPELEAKGYIAEGNLYCKDEETWLPFYEGKMVGMYDHRASSIRFDPTNRVRRNQPVAFTLEDHRDPDHLAMPMFWVSAQAVSDRCNELPRWCLAVKDVTSSTNERTAIAAILPSAALTHSVPWISTGHSAQITCCLLANLGSFVLDFIARQKVAGLHLFGHYLAQLPLIALSTIETQYEWFASRVLELSFSAWDLAAFATECNYDGSPFIWDEDRRFEIRCELDAAFFHLYGIDNIDDVDYILETFPIVKRKDIKKHGSYRTKERILEIYQQMARCTATGSDSGFKSSLNPPPGPPTDATEKFIPMSEWDPQNWPSHIHRPKEDVEEEVHVVSVPAERYPLTTEVYACRILPQLIRESGGSLPVKQAAMAYALLADADLRAQLNSITYQGWERNFDQQVEMGAFRIALDKLVTQEFLRWKGDVLDGYFELDDWAKEEVEACIIEDAKVALDMARQLPEPLQQASTTIKQILGMLAA